MFDATDNPGPSRSAPEGALAQAAPSPPGRGGHTAVDRARRTPPAVEPLWTRLGHELRTPLHAILGNVELLVDGSAGPLSADARACLGDVQNAGRQLLSQIDLVLLVIQAEAMPGPGAEDAIDLFERMRIALHRQVPGAEIAPEGGRLVVRGDPFWLDTCVSALLETVFAAPADTGAGRVEIARAADPAPHEIALRIACSGGDARPPSPIVPMLVDAVMRLHGGRLLPHTETGVCFAWPKSRLVTWQTG